MQASDGSNWNLVGILLIYGRSQVCSWVMKGSVQETQFFLGQVDEKHSGFCALFNVTETFGFIGDHRHFNRRF